jgi:parvulin-like peptidyl-prolyl isomerase
LAKKRPVKPKREVTKRQLSRWQQQKRRQRFILTLGISVIASVLLLVGVGVYYGWYIPEYRTLRQTVIEVNDVSFDMGYYIDSLKFHSAGQTQYLQFFLDSVVENIEQNELIQRKALELGFSVSQDEIKQEIEENSLPDNQAVRDFVRAQLLATLLMEEYFAPQVPASAEHRHVMAMFLESQSQAEEVTARLEAGEDFAQLAGELSLDNATKENGGDLNWRPQGFLDSELVTSVIDELVFDAPVGVLSQPVYDEEKFKSLGYWLIEVLEKNPQLSTPEGSKADLGWLSPGSMGEAFEEFVFDPETALNTISEPIRDEATGTTGGYWLFKVLGSEQRELSEEDRSSLASQALNDWRSSLLTAPENTVTSYLDDEMKDFATSKVLEG